MKAARVLLVTALAAAALGAAPAPPPLVAIERDFADWRDAQDAVDVAEARGVAVTAAGAPVAEARSHAQAMVTSLRPRLAAVRVTGEDARAVEVMRQAVGPDEPESAPPPAAARSLDCDFDAAKLLARGPKALRERTYDCYGQAARTVTVGGETLDRLTVLGRLSQEPDPEARRRLFLALAPIWASMNRDGSLEASPYRLLARAEGDRWKASSPVTEAAVASGVDPERLERWLVSVLEAWRDVAAVPGEPWDLWHGAGEVSRQLSPRIPRERLRAVNDAWFHDLGADPTALGVRYDLDPREGKTPVAFATFGARHHSIGRGLHPAEPWVFATYREGGFDNLVELLHETGHAVHIAAIRTRPAFGDWPDSNPFSEALGDLLALDAYEPAWQQKYLGASASEGANLRAKYATVMLDVCWALFEWRVHHDPGADPNQVWTELTREYLKVAPHPELSWWALRGQLIESPGYMMNYAIGALMVADLRERRGPASPATYADLSQRLYRFGLERPSVTVLREYLGRDVTADALLRDLRRLAPRRQGIASARSTNTARAR